MLATALLTKVAAAAEASALLPTMHEPNPIESVEVFVHDGQLSVDVTVEGRTLPLSGPLTPTLTELRGPGLTVVIQCAKPECGEMVADVYLDGHYRQFASEEFLAEP